MKYVFKSVAMMLFALLLSNTGYSQANNSFYSQCGQDSFLHHKFFSTKRDGVFVDIGAHDGKTYSNTYFFENRGWKGLCIEPLPEIFAQLCKNRTCICIEGCIYDKADVARFLRVGSLIGEHTDMLSGIVENYHPNHLRRIAREISNGAGFCEEIVVKCYSLNELLEQHNFHHVDYLSIDTGGGELDILKSIDFERFTIDVIGVENNYNGTAFEQFLKTKGYQKLTQFSYSSDEIYVRTAWYTTQFFTQDFQQKPRVSIITSVFDPEDLYVAEFLRDIVRQTIFEQCELLLLCPPTPGNAATIIQEYCNKYPNIRHIKLDNDPGLYAVWNIGITLAKADLITNANIDDRRNPCCLEMHAQALEADPSITLVYSPFYYSESPNTTFEDPRAKYIVDPGDFAQHRMRSCLPGPMPMWRKSIHAVCGYFREDFFSSGDYEMWNRMVSVGAVFKRVSELSGVYYCNPQGLSSDPNHEKVQRRQREDQTVIALYSYLWSDTTAQNTTAEEVNHKKIWSILICTLDERVACFEKIYTKLHDQIVANGLEDQIEILFFKDNREASIGFKRNALVEQSCGEYVCFVDDDDDVHNNYIAMIYRELLKKPDCVSLVGIITTRGEDPKKFIHSIRYNQWFEDGGVYYRPPNHLNPVKRSIASQFKFPEISYWEDRVQSVAMVQSGLLKVEATIDEPYYFYLYDDQK